MVDYESPISAQECTGFNGDAMADFDTLFDQLLREVLKFVYQGNNQLMYLLGKDAFRMLFISQLTL